MDEEVRKEKGDEEFERRKEELRRRDEMRTSRNKAKREKMKARKLRGKEEGGAEGMEGVETVEAGVTKGAKSRNGLGLGAAPGRQEDDEPVEVPVSSEGVGVIIHDDD